MRKLIGIKDLFIYDTGDGGISIKIQQITEGKIYEEYKDGYFRSDCGSVWSIETALSDGSVAVIPRAFVALKSIKGVIVKEKVYAQIIEEGGINTNFFGNYFLINAYLPHNDIKEINPLEMNMYVGLICLNTSISTESAIIPGHIYFEPEKGKLILQNGNLSNLSPILAGRYVKKINTKAVIKTFVDEVVETVTKREKFFTVNNRYFRISRSIYAIEFEYKNGHEPRYDYWIIKFAMVKFEKKEIYTYTATVQVSVGINFSHNFRGHNFPDWVKEALNEGFDETGPIYPRTAEQFYNDYENSIKFLTSFLKRPSNETQANIVLE